jgi:hypothetical protein
MAVGRKPRWFNPMWITTAEISQVSCCPQLEREGRPGAAY